ncbi:alpha/beta fold hydrolase [Streptomyces sp. AV19]|uniref:alpha/beta fold hydrolase n=1 Tax=Streptomyces sp. AV19 TaxID=2793068 RepID=UPI0018FE2D7C|nr:alpha/beta fold hydrolase [Streptomyces sp. AV19]MBH1937335.1 alpha/beta fold hydrolase [Streptomyces sp. AV19]MDG4534681.1 alpha/beta fold hydrolase [Streptomyces sp. AV19]
MIRRGWALLLAVLLCFPPCPAQAASAGRVIPVAPGVALDAEVFPPAPGAGRHPPLLVMPGVWVGGRHLYAREARRYARAGYLVVAYSPRGFGSSTGEVGTAGPEDVADVSAVIDWAVRRWSADPGRVGLLGHSYGAGIALLGAAADPRVSAVVAVNGWAELEEAFFTNGTAHTAAVRFQYSLARLFGRPGRGLTRFATGVLAGRDDPRLRAWAAARSPQRRVRELNARGTAVFLVNNWNDTLLAAPNQMARFFESLTGPKHLELRPGEHGEATIHCLTDAVPPAACGRAGRWLDRYVRGRGPLPGPPLLVRPRPGPPADERHASWRAMTAGEFAAPFPSAPRTVRTGLDSGADAGLPVLSPVADKRGLPPVAVLPLLPPGTAARWETSPARHAVRGAPRLRIRVTPSAPEGTFFAYLYDVGPPGVGRLISHVPVTFRNRAAGRPFTAETEMTATAYDIPPGHRLGLVADTVDPLYAQRNPAGARIAFDGPRLTVPFGGAPLR